MARAVNRLSAVFVKGVSEPGRYADGGGLYLSTTGGGRRWVFLFRWHGRTVEMGLGSARDVPLAKAREDARRAREQVASGINPLRARETIVAQTFGQCADALIENMAPSWRNAKHGDQWRMTLKEYAKPLRNLNVADVTTKDVVAVLRPIWSTKAETASRTRGRIERVLDFAKASGLRTGENPARWRGHLDQILPPRKRLTRGHHAALPYDQMPSFMDDLRARPALAARALEFTILTAARTGEILGARWWEIDLGAAVWTVPAERMKAAREHRVPLSAAAIGLLSALPKGRPADFVFPHGKPDVPMSSMAMTMLLRRMKAGVTAHGFRSSFRDWSAETTGFPHEVCEMALAHVIQNKAEAAYRRGDLFEKRRGLMDAWALYCGYPTERSIDAEAAS